MKAKHLTKNTMSHKLVFLAVGIAIAIIAAFSICATNKANAESNNQINDTISSVVVTQPGDDSAKGGSVYAWHKIDEKVQPSQIKWHNGLNVIEQYSQGHIITKIEYSHYLKVLYIYLYDNNSMSSELRFTANSKTPAVDWYVGPEKVDSHTKTLTENATFTTSTIGPSESVKISGKVMNSDGVPVSGALVEFNSKVQADALTSSEYSTNTFEDGTFVLSDVPTEAFPGSVTITKDGFEPYTSTEITKSQVGFVDISLGDVSLIPKEEPIPPSPDPTPEPTPTNSATVSGGTAQTGDDASVAFAFFGLLMLAGSGVLIARKLYAN